MLKFQDLAHAAHWHAPVHAHQFTKLHEHEHEMHDEMATDIFHQADIDGSGTVSADGFCDKTLCLLGPPCTHELPASHMWL